MASEDAPGLGALDAAWRASLQALAESMDWRGYDPAMATTIRGALAVIDAQAARLAAVEAERDQQTALAIKWDERDHEKTVQLARLERERDQARADAADAMLAHGLAVEALRHVEAACKRDLAAAERRATRVETFIATLRDEMHVQSDPYAREYGDRIDDTLKVWAVEKLA